MAEDGTFIAYAPRAFGSVAMARIGVANDIIRDYRKDGLTLTLRQLYYQFVARGYLPNEQKEYNSLGRLISDARMAGLVSWTAIEDRTRGLRGTQSFINPGQAIRTVRNSYRRDLWQRQEFRPEVWIEKDALVGVIEGICVQERVDFFSCRGYNSQSEQWRAGRRFQRYVCAGQRPIVFHLGDHDPSGVDMTRDNQERLSLFCGVPVMVVRLALNMDQIERYAPPPNPVKFTDSRATGYVAAHGEQSWELDAMEPRALRDLIRASLARLRDDALWNISLLEEADDLRALDTIIEEMDE